MKKIFILISLFASLSHSQIFTGRVVSNTQQGLEEKKVEIYFNTDGINGKLRTLTDSSGKFSADSIISLIENYGNSLPIGYNVSYNYPNPFNPRTLLNITIPQSSFIQIDVYSILGEKISTIGKKVYPAGSNKIVIELNGFANGVYIARINIDEKYFVSRKMLYGSQHASEVNFLTPKLKKANTTTIVDSVIITGDAIKKTVFIGFPTYTSSSIDLGAFQVDSNYINLTVSVKKLMEWQHFRTRENYRCKRTSKLHNTIRKK